MNDEASSFGEIMSSFSKVQELYVFLYDSYNFFGIQEISDAIRD